MLQQVVYNMITLTFILIIVSLYYFAISIEICLSDNNSSHLF
jgi:hypothetical protein